METNNLISIPRTFSTYSFDVFDTVLTRCFNEPKDLFAEIEQRLVMAGNALDGFAPRRVEAEYRVRERSQFRVEVSLDEIYNELASTWLGDSQALAQAKLAEFELELASIVVHRPMVDALNQLRAAGKKIIFISDIYLPEAFIKRLLTSLDILKPEDKLFVSSTHKCMKAWGDLFDIALAECGIAAADICHIGDSFRSDVEQAHQRGLHAIHAKRLLATRYEKLVPPSNPIAAKLAGAARATRALNPYPPGAMSTIWDTTAQVSAPLLFAFSTWCMVRAKSRGIETLYYLSRDGQIIKKIADQIAAVFPEQAPRSRYLYVSRQALLFPGLVEFSRENLDWVLARTHGLTLRDVLQRIRFEASELDIPQDMLEQWGGVDMPLAETALRQLEAILLQNHSRIEARAAEHRLVVLEYLQQEGFLQQPSIGVVDIGWNGTLQRALSNMLRTTGSRQMLTGFYFGLRKRPAMDASHDNFEGWFSTPEHAASIESKAYIVPMMELFTAADHGGATGYCESSSGIKPKLRSTHNTKALNWGLAVQHEAALTFAQNILRVLREDELEHLPEMARGYADALLEEFLLRPTREEALAYCAYEDAEDQNEVRYNKMGRPYSLNELSLYFSKDYMHHHNEWRQGALAITDASLVDFAWRMHCAKAAV